MISKDGGEQILHARLNDLCAKAQKGVLGVSQFLSPAELNSAKRHLRTLGVEFVSYGGYSDAERCRVYILPEYMTVGEDIDETLEEYGFSSEICAIMITGSGYRKLTHRDFLGSLLGLGLERAVIGDILVTDENGREAVVLCDTTICGFIESELLCVANDKVRVKRLQNGEWEAPARRTVALHDTVASPRIDAVVSAICGISREKAREAVVSGLVEIDFEREERPDRTVGVPSVVSVRGVGKFKINSLSDKTKKGRYRLEAEKYV